MQARPAVQGLLTRAIAPEHHRRMELKQAGIVVFCGSSPGTDPAFLDEARTLGSLIAQEGASLVYGGATVGCMGAVADAALAGGGRVVGIIPRSLVAREIAHRGLTVLEEVDTMHERKARMNHHGSAYVVLPGGYGTMEEMFEVITWKQIGLHVRPIVLVDVKGFWSGVRTQIEQAVQSGFMRPHFRDYLIVVKTAREAIDALKAFAPPAQDISKFA